jgi:hypothetical protein
VITDEDWSFFEFIPRNRVTQGLFKLFQNNQVFGLNEKNQYCKQKNDEVRYQNLIMSMTSVNLKPVIKNTLESMMDFKPPQPKQGADGFERGQRNVPFSHQVIAEVSLSMPSIKEIKE